MNPRRQVGQRLQSLRRAGVDRIPRPRRKVRDADTKAQSPAAPIELEPTVTLPLPPTRTVETQAVADSTSLFNLNASELPEPIAPPLRPKQLDVLSAEVAACVRCEILARTRTRTVFGEGSPTARLMFIGEAPGADEDRTGRPFVGRAGQLLTDMITRGMGLAREDVYIANVLKCRPPENRPPLPDEAGNCRGYLERQLDIIQPEFLCLLGRTAATAVLDTSLAMGKLRGHWYTYRGIKTIVTYHPAYLLRNPASKRDTWEDLKLLMAAMGLPTPAKS